MIEFIGLLIKGALIGLGLYLVFWVITMFGAAIAGKMKGKDKGTGKQ